MITTIIFAVWGCAITLATLFVGVQMKASAVDEMEVMEEVVVPPVISKPMTLVAPVVVDQKTTGYVFSNVSLEMNREVLSETSIPLEIVLQDSYLAHMVGNPDFSFPKTEQFELASFKQGLKHQLNQSIGDELVEAIYVSGVNFIGIAESRSKQTLKSIWIQEQTSAFDKLPKANK